LLVGDQPGGDLRYPVTGEEISGFGWAEPASFRRAIQEGLDERSRVVVS
jgi:dTDP-D-glucose 4,6-dehydratase